MVGVGMVGVGYGMVGLGYCRGRVRYGRVGNGRSKVM